MLDHTLLQTLLAAERVAYLQSVRGQLPLLDKEDQQALLVAALNTYNYYQDAASRGEISALLSKYIDAGYGSAIAKFITPILRTAKSIALTDLLTLLDWANLLVVKVADDSIYEIWANMVRLCLEGSSRPTHRDERIFKSVVANAKVALSKSLNLERLANLVQRFDITVISIVAEVAIDLQPTHPEFYNYISENSLVIVANFNTSLNTNFPKVPALYQLLLFGKFTHEFLSAETVFDVVSNAEKLIMKNSEVALGLLVPSLVKNFNSESKKAIVESKFIDKILAGLKNSKEVIRSQSYATLTYLSYADYDVLINASKTGTADSKILLYKRLAHISVDNKHDFLAKLAPIVKKDVNEATLTYLIPAFVSNYLSTETDAAYQAILNDGCKQKKLNLRRLWFIAIASYIKLHPSYDDASKFESLDYKSSIDEYLNAPILFVNNKGISAILVSVFLITKFSLAVDVSKVLRNEKFPLVSTKIFNKLSDESDVSSAAALLLALESSEFKDYGACWLYLLASTNVSASSRRATLALVNPEIAAAVIDATLKYLIESEEFSVNHPDELSINLKNISVISKQLIRFHNSIKLLLIANYEPLRVKDYWIGLTQSIGLNIEGFITENFGDIYALITEIFSSQKTDSQIFASAIKSVGQLCLVAPKLIIPELIASFENELLTFKIDATTLSIWENESELPVINVLKNSKLDKNSKNYETEKWELELRKELKKVSKEDQKLVNEQKNKELAIKDEVSGKVKDLIKNFKIINELIEVSKNFDTSIDSWYPSIINICIKLFENTHIVNKVTSDLFTATFLNLSSSIDSKLDSTFKALIGHSTIKFYTNQPVEDSVISRILFRVKFLSDQLSFDIVTISYLFPLLIKILVIGYEFTLKSNKAVTTSEFVNEEPQEEHLLLALDILTSNAESFANRSIPRHQLLLYLVKLLKLPSKLKVAKECFISICSNISVDFELADLDVLFDNLISADNNTKLVVLEVLDLEFELPLDTSDELWVTSHDNDDHIAEISKNIWAENELEITKETPYHVIEKFSDQESSGLRLSIALSAVDAVKDQLDEFLDFLFKFYDIKSRPPPPKLDEYGLVIKTSAVDRDQWESRSTVALVLKLLTTRLNESQIIKVFEFLIQQKALNDKNDMVLQELQDAGIEIIEKFELKQLEGLIALFESSLETVLENRIKESVIILYGSLGRHFSADDNKVNMILDRLMTTLMTPSENIQIAISKCLASLTHLFDSLQSYFDKLFDDLFDAKYNVKIRKGCAYGISGLVKGLGIKALQDYNIMRLLNDAADDKKDAVKRESVSLVYECLSFNLGKFFEPYVIEILPTLLISLGDQSPEVRAATDRAAKVIMSNTTSFGVKKLIPLAISNLDEIAWRSKKGSVELLGSMAYLDPAQLSSSLSIIIPEIVGVLNDTHKEVRKAADQALKRFGEVIRNPEIQKIVPDLIKAIGDPTKYTDAALEKLIKTQFVHYIDGPSLALIIHVIHRGMKDRSASTKRKACQIVGNMAILVDTRDLKPYLSSLVQELELSMVDPVPATRSTAARALGSLVEKLGEEQFPDLIPKLLGNLQDESKVGDRLGSAQALSEVISGLGLSKLDDLLPVILANAQSPQAYIRAGFMPLLLYLPVCFGSQFASYLSKIIPPILNGLADSDEEIRDTALRAGRLIVKNYAKVAIDLLLPELEAGLNDTNYRIRLSSVELTGDLLFQVTGISGKNELIEEDEFNNSGEINKSLVEILGEEHRDKVLSLLFICRSDVNNMVRTKSIEIWKALVANTPKMVKEILPELVSIIIKKLASDDEMEKTMAATTMGEMVRRVGANSLSQILPNLVKLLDTLDSNVKEGVCIAVSELIKSTSEEGLHTYQDTFIDIIRKTLVDENTNVRNASAAAFDSLQSELGKKVVDDIIPNLLNMLESDDSEYALLALQDIMSTKSDIIFPILIPTLLSPPIDNFKIGALSSLASVAGNALYKKLSLIINTMVDLIVDAKDEDSEFIKASFDKILVSINDQDGINPLMQTLLLLTKHEDYKKRAIVYERLGEFFAHTNLNYSVYLTDMVSSFILSLGDKSVEVVKGTFEALSSLIKAQPKEVLEKLVKPANQALTITGVQGEELEAFKLPKGPNCILPIFLQGLMYGNSEQKELSADSIADIIDKTPASNLRPFSTTITGPLIRIIGEKVNSNIKASILVAINNLLVKIPQFLRPFIPQLQRTFVRLLSDPSNDDLRNRAVEGLGILIKFQPRIDSLVIELISGCKNSESDEIKLTMLKAIFEIVQKSGDKLNEPSKRNVMSLIEEEFVTAKGKVSIQYAKLLGIISKVLTTDETESIVKSKILVKDEPKFAIIGINAFLKDSSEKLASLVDEIIAFIIDLSNESDNFLCENATLAIGKLMLSPLELSAEQAEKLDLQLCKLITGDTSLDAKRIATIIFRTLGRKNYHYIENSLDLIAPSVFSNVRATVIPIKLASEKCFLSIFKLTETEDIFNAWIERQPDPIEAFGAKFVKRSISDYTRRVSLRLAKIEVERIEQGGDDETVFSDRIEDEQEIWSIGGV